MGIKPGPTGLVIDDYPPVGAALNTVVAGYSGTGQLRLHVA